MDESVGLGSLFPYYAGFSFEWATAELDRHARSGDDVVLDSWNGSGTTTTAAGALGLPSVGIDMSPLATVVAAARGEVALGEASSCVDFELGESPEIAEDDPLLRWFAPDSAATLRRLAGVLESDSRHGDLRWIALFRTVRDLTRDLEGSNPTWVRAAPPDCKVSMSAECLVDHVNGISRLLRAEYSDKHLAGFRLPTIVTGDARAVSLNADAASLILTSPPYLTRIDYAVAFSRELALLDAQSSSLDVRRRMLMGTTASRRGLGSEHAKGKCSATAEALIEAVRRHPSKDSAGYYCRNVQQYFSDLSLSVAELDRVARPEARVGIVVQDSFYKDLRIGLGAIVVEEASNVGWRLLESSSHPVSRSLVTLNSAARRYPKSDVSEHVLWFETSKRSS